MNAKRTLVAALLLLGTLLVAAPGHAAAATTKKCHGKTATIVLTSPGTVDLTASDDVVYGSSGSDDIERGVDGGTDYVCGNGGDDYLGAVGPGSIADGGPGRDFVYAEGGATALGGSGDDYGVYACGLGSTADGGAGDENLFRDIDVVMQTAAAADVDDCDIGPLSTDIVPIPVFFLGVVAVNGATGTGGSGNDWVSGFYAASLQGGSGNDYVAVFGGPTAIDCGSGYDYLYHYSGEQPSRRCEDIETDQPI